ncbi:hypothetical protein [Rhodoligotrophos defluvii]|uniref:hypothetical protein n=1 Tax=Rhodoligotrophos defluvii TaxID=2561934 RepID=UPI0010C99232|nr:hypothetical protein [Rhodoligotrophos defluvii]
MAGSKTHEQQLRTFERKPDIPRPGEPGTDPNDVEIRTPDREARQSEMPVSRGGMNQESRNHNKHNHPTQSGHRPQPATTEKS